MAAKPETVRVVSLTETDLEALLERAASAGAARVSPPPEILTAEETAALLRLNAQTVQRLAAAGEIPSKRLGREWRFRRSEILAWFESKQGKVA